MEMQKITGKYITDSYFKIKHPTGLDILIYPKEKFSTSYAIFGTKYGSIDNKFKFPGEDEFVKVPEGIAHYLEHKMFEDEKDDAFERYSKTGASANAFTSFDSTCYLFSCTDKFYDSLEILLDFVQSPYFTEETVNKERGIINQEIKMYEDNPNWRVLFNFLRAIYHENPVKEDIAGTVETIAEITPELLHKCYKSFYNLNNMALCIAGDINPDKVLEVCNKMLKKAEPMSTERCFPNEPDSIVQPYIEQKLSVGIPVFVFGFKENVKTEYRKPEELAAMGVLLEIFSSDSSPLFRRLLDEGLISESSFSNEYFEGRGYANVMFSGESKNPKKVAEVIMEEAEKLKNNGIKDEDFERAKKACYGEIVQSLNSTSSVSNLMISTNFQGFDVFSYVEAFPSLTKDKVESKLLEIFDSEKSALSVVLPQD